MLRTILIVAVLLSHLGSLRAQTVLVPGATAALPQQQMAQAEAQLAAASWLTLLDSGKYAESWVAAADSFHQDISQDGWVTLLKGGTPVFGSVVSRKLKESAFSRVLPHAPDGQYVVLKYQTEFSVLKDATEQIALVLAAGGQWKVCGYHIK